MSAASFDPRRLELLRFAESGGRLEGTWPAAAFERMTADAPVVGDVRWAARGELEPVAGGAPATWLVLEAGAAVRLECQRCLQAMAHPLAVRRRLRFVGDETEAQRLDEACEDDVLALPPRGRLDLLPLVEDELILALPIVPRHENCPEPLAPPADAAEAAPAEHPFAVLAALKRRPD
jgi:uncharacterized protein